MGVAGSVLTGTRRPFAQDARSACAPLGSGLQVIGATNVPSRGPCLVTCNHYSRVGFDAWWVALAISAVVAEHREADADPEIRWVMTGAWTFPDSPWQRRFLTPVTQRLFRRVAAVYGFVTMPPMPAALNETEERASAVLRTVRLARRLAPRGGMIGLSPEGMDTPGGVAPPPPGVGRFVALLVEAGMPVLPVGIAEGGDRLLLSFGSPLTPTIPLRRADREGSVSEQVMDAIRREVAAIA